MGFVILFSMGIKARECPEMHIKDGKVGDVAGKMGFIGWEISPAGW